MAERDEAVEAERDEAVELTPARVEAGGALPILFRMLSRSASSEPVPRALLRPLLLPVSLSMSTYEPLVGVPDARVREELVGREVLPERGVLLPVVDRGVVVPEGRRLAPVDEVPVREREVERRVAEAARSDAVGGGGGRVDDERRRGDVERVSVPERDVPAAKAWRWGRGVGGAWRRGG